MATDSMRSRAQAAMPHIMALNKDPSIGMKANRMPGPLKPVQAFAKGGKVSGKLVQFYAKGGAVKCMAKGGKAKSGAKKVMGTVKEAKQIIGALKAAKKPMTPPPGLAGASPMTAPMGAGVPPPMKKGGKVKKLAMGGAAKSRLKEPMPKPIKKVPYVNGD